MANHTFGWKPDIQDQRDYKYSTVRKAVELPEYVDLRSKCTTVEDQGNLGSCTANAAVGLLEYLDAKPDNKYVNLSRLFVYYNTRLIEGSIAYDSGASIRGVMKSMAKYGACAEAYWPYKIEKFKTKPTARCYTNGLTRLKPNYYRMKTIGEIRASLAEGVPVLFGFTVYENLESGEAARTGMAQMPLPNEAALGGHAVLAVGYDNAKQLLIVRNSWGSDWGDKGYFYMPYAYVTTGIAQDFWTVR